MPGSPRRRRWLAVAALVAVAGAAAALRARSEGSPAAPALPPPPRVGPDACALHLHLDKPLEPGRNALWSAAGPRAFEALAAALGGRLTVGPPANEDDFAALARGPSYGAATDGVPLVVAAGRGPDVPARFAAGVAARFRDAVATPDLTVPSDGAAAFAALAAAPGPAAARAAPPGPFAGSPVEAFMLDLRGPASAGVRSADGDEGRWAVAWDAADGRERAVVAVLPRPATLGAGAAAATALLADAAAPALAADGVELPAVAMRVERAFPAWAGAPVRTPSGAVTPLAALGFRVDLRVGAPRVGSDPSGAAAPEADRGAAPAARRRRVDRPFLLAVTRRGADAPYLVAWFERADGLVAVSATDGAR